MNTNFADLLLADFRQMILAEQLQGAQRVSLPMAAISGVCIAVCISQLDDGRYVISDEGYLSDPGCPYNEQTGIEHHPSLIEHYKIQFTEHPRTKINIAYLKTDKLDLVTSRMFDLGHYMLATLNWRILRNS